MHSDPLPKRTNKLELIEAARGIAAVLVVLYHVARHIEKDTLRPFLGKFFQFGHAGVDLFFVLSGFIILYVHHKDIDQPDKLAHYLRRRVSRVVPVYWVALAITIAMGLAGGNGFPKVFDVAKSIFLLPSDSELILGVAWTLTYEVIFYLAFAVLIVHRILGLVMFFIWFGTVLLSLAGFQLFQSLPRSIFGAYNFEFLFGMVTAFMVLKYKLSNPKALLIVGIVLFLIVGASENLGILNGYSDLARFIYGPISALIVAGAVQSGLRESIPAPTILRILGGASYSIYLFQFVFIGVTWQVLRKIGLACDSPLICILIFLLLSASAIIGGVLLSRWVEYPLMALFRKAQSHKTLKYQ